MAPGTLVPKPQPQLSAPPRFHSPMQAIDPLGLGLTLTGETGRARLRARIDDLRSEIGPVDYRGLVATADDVAREGEALRDAVSTSLMELFRRGTGRAIFGLLYELNCQHLLVQV